MPASRHVLVTAFEPSGDALAAPLIAELIRRDPTLRVHGLGGPRMAAAGADLIETTIENAVVGVPPLKKIVEHKARVRRLRDWMARHELAAVVPTDSPAANWDVCRLARALQPKARVVHLAAPQLWAWASWRIHKMRRLSDHVLCLLPFEPDWFGRRGVAGTFVGHPIFDKPPEARAAQQRRDPADYPDAPHKLALLPGSRPSEWRNNWPTIRRVAAELPGPPPATLVAAVDQRAADFLAQHPPTPDTRIAQTDAVLHWADAVLAVSGTVTLQVAAHRRPMVVLYHVHPATWHLAARWLIATRTFALPNLIGEWLGLGRRVPEFVPHFNRTAPIADALARLRTDSPERRGQLELFDGIHRVYANARFAHTSADVLTRLVG